MNGCLWTLAVLPGLAGVRRGVVPSEALGLRRLTGKFLVFGSDFSPKDQD
jgi:hypothetical protein